MLCAARFAWFFKADFFCKRAFEVTLFYLHMQGVLAAESGSPAGQFIALNCLLLPLVQVMNSETKTYFLVKNNLETRNYFLVEE